MLKRELESIIAAVANPYNDLRATEAKKYSEKQKEIQDTYRKDARYLAVATALKGAGVSTPEEHAWKLVTMVGGGSGSVFADMRAAMAAVPGPKMPGFYGSAIHSELSIALNTCGKKWPALQTDVYLLIASLGSAKTEEDIAKAVRTFTAAIA